jgi:hypothetical protein
MANKVRGEIAADFEGGKINLILSTNAICELEDAANRPITALLDEVGDPARVRMKTVRLLFWALMLDERPDATVADAGRLIDGLRGNHDRIMTDAILAAFPDAQEGAAPGK